MSSPTFDRVAALCIDKRFDEQGMFISSFQKLGIQVTPFIAGDGKLLPAEQYDHIDIEPPGRSGYPAWANRPNSYNASLCFKKIIAAALADGVETLLILEDDAQPTDEFASVLPAAWKQLQEHNPNWSMLYLGANHTHAATTEVSPNLLRLNGSGCWHAVVLRKKVFQAVLDLPLENPIDGVVAKYLHSREPCYAVWPNIVVTKPGFSYCEGREVNYLDMFKNKGC